MKIYTKEDILTLLKKNDQAVARGVVRIFERQLADEQNVEFTKHVNGKGFNKPDAPFLTSVAKFYQRNNYLSPKQIYATRKRLLKYAGQLAQIANDEVSIPMSKRNTIPAGTQVHLGPNIREFTKDDRPGQRCFSTEASDLGWDNWPEFFELRDETRNYLTIYHATTQDISPDGELQGVWYEPAYADKYNYGSFLVIND